MSEKKEAEIPVYEVLNRIKQGGLDPALLSKETRESCVEALMGEGYTTLSIAALLRKSDRTIRRDAVMVRKRNSISASPEFSGIIGGELLSTARSQYGRLKQIARSNDVSAKDKAKVEYMSWLVCKEVADKLHKLGFLPVIVDESLFQKAEKEKAPDLEIDPEMQKIFKNMLPMDRDRLVEKLYKEIVRLEKGEEKESSKLSA